MILQTNLFSLLLIVHTRKVGPVTLDACRQNPKTWDSGPGNPKSLGGTREPGTREPGTREWDRRLQN